MRQRLEVGVGVARDHRQRDRRGVRRDRVLAGARRGRGRRAHVLGQPLPGPEGEPLHAEGAVAAGVVGRAGRRHPPHRVVQHLGVIALLDLGPAQVGQAEAVGPPPRLGNDQVRHQPFEHAAAECRDERDRGAGVYVVALPDLKLLVALRIGDRLPVPRDRPLPLPGEVRVGGAALGRQRPPRAPPHVAGHLVQAHADVHGDAGVGVQRAVVVAGRSLVDVEASVLLAGRLIARQRGVGVAIGLGAVVVEDGEVHVSEQPARQVAHAGQRLARDDQPRRVPAVVHRRDEPAVVLASGSWRCSPLGRG